MQYIELTPNGGSYLKVKLLYDPANTLFGVTRVPSRLVRDTDGGTTQPLGVGKKEWRMLRCQAMKSIAAPTWASLADVTGWYASATLGQFYNLKTPLTGVTVYNVHLVNKSEFEPFCMSPDPTKVDSVWQFIIALLEK